MTLVEVSKRTEKILKKQKIINGSLYEPISFT